MTFVAHSPPPDRPDQGWHGLKEHLEGTAALAARFAAPFGASKAAALAGLVHDLGKYAPEFQRYIRGETKQGVEHAIAGARWLHGMEGGAADRVVARLLAHAVAGHHAGLPNSLGGLDDALARPEIPLDEAWKSEIAPDTVGLSPTGFRVSDVAARHGFEIAFLGRMIFSALVDADFKDTEAYYVQAESREVERDWPALQAILPDLIARFDAHMAEKAKGAEGDVNALRNRVLAHIRAQAGRAPDTFTLTVPTGGGKTLASLGFALDHAKAHPPQEGKAGGLRRIVYAIPFTSVIDQTAAIFRAVLGENVVLEHHSAIEEPPGKHKDRSARDKLRLAMEDWAAPVVVTTHVQLFESLFAARPSRCRKLHALAGAVIVLDEAQTMPLGLLKPCVAALRELERGYGASVVLCTATQPALDEMHFVNDPVMGLTLNGRELAPDPPDLHRQLNRVTFRQAGAMQDAALLRELAATPQGLIIVNSRAHALALYRLAKTEWPEADGLHHLSTRQCAVHRRALLAEIRQRLMDKDKPPCRVISTSLVEAGVDVDFPRLWRAEAGLEQIVQAAGRCNREGRRPAEDSIVTIFTAPDAPPPPELARNAEVFTRIAAAHADFAAPATVERYFRELYWQAGPKALDRLNVLGRFAMDRSGPVFEYRSVGEEFRMVEDWGRPVIIRDPENADILRKLDVPELSSGGLARALQIWTVQVPPRAFDALEKAGMLEFPGGTERANQFAVLSDAKLYAPETGLVWEDAGIPFWAHF